MQGVIAKPREGTLTFEKARRQRESLRPFLTVASVLAIGCSLAMLLVDLARLR